MSNAFKLVEQFESRFSKDNQIFITTHSPAFYDLSSEKVSKWLVTSEQYEKTEHLSSKAHPVSLEDNEPDERLGIAEFVKHRAKELYLSHEALEKNVRILEEEISDYTKPVIVTEGKFDVVILKTAWKKLNPDEEMPFEITSCSTGESTDDEKAGAKQLQTYLDSILYTEDKIRIGIFDSDKAGMEYYQRLRRFKNHKGSIKIHENGKAHALLLPTPPNEKGEYWPTNNICIEFLFKKEYLTDSYVQRVYYGADGKPASEPQATTLDRKFEGQSIEQLGSLFKREYEIRSNRKKRFAEKKVPSFPPDAFSMFSELYKNINSILNIA